MKIIFLIAPSEGKNIGGSYIQEKLNFNFEKPLDIAINATYKDLKCKGDRFKKGINLNNSLEKGPFLEAINRYNGLVFNAIDYSGMSNKGKDFFEENILILSGMYGLLKPLDKIGNYKLPIETKGLYKFWGDKITDKLNEVNPDFIVNLLPNSYLKMINQKDINGQIININFLIPQSSSLLKGEGREQKYKKISHGVKKYRGEFLRKICEDNLTDYKQFGGEVVKNGNFININIFV